ncbi:MAG: hypothetical protein ABH837_02085 [bacterium]
MSRVLTLSRCGYIGKKAKHSTGEVTKFGPMSLRIIAVVVLTMLALLYLAQSQAGVTKGYEIKDLETQKAQIIEKNEELNIHASKLRSIKNIQIDLKKLELVPSGVYTYLK